MTISADTISATTLQEVDERVTAAAGAARILRALPSSERAESLEAVADALDAAADDLVPVAGEETGLAEARLRGELARTTAQLRMFADVLVDGSYLAPIIDTADPEAQPAPRPDLRRALVPLGPVVVYAASNFPFAFSVAGGDSAAALAAGCPVIVKAHPGHERLSRLTDLRVRAALAGARAPDGTFATVFGREAGTAALVDPRVKAGAFTGSIPGGRALFDLAAARPEPIPFYGELGSLNPVFVTRRALQRRRRAIVEGYVGSFTLGTGQFCTKPGLLFLPAGHGLEPELVDAVRAVAPARMLNERIHSGYARELGKLASHPAVRTLVAGASGEGLDAAPTLLGTSIDSLRDHGDELLTECFGPTSIVVEYEDEAQLVTAVEAFGGQLTATIHGDDDDAQALQALIDLLVERVGRLVWNGWPTGVAVAWAMHHGGPYPATTAPLHTSVGATAIGRFLRPVCHQSAPQALLPEVLRDRNTLGAMRRVNGRLTRHDVTS